MAIKERQTIVGVLSSVQPTVKRGQETLDPADKAYGAESGVERCGFILKIGATMKNRICRGENLPILYSLNIEKYPQVSTSLAGGLSISHQNNLATF